MKQEVDDDLNVCVYERSPCGLSITGDIKICPVACKEKKINLYYFTSFYMILHDFINCPTFVDIKQTLRHKLALE